MPAPLYLNAYFPSCNGSTYTVHFRDLVEPRAPTAPCYWVHCTVVPLHHIGELTVAWGGLMKIRSPAYSFKLSPSLPFSSLPLSRFPPLRLPPPLLLSHLLPTSPTLLPSHSFPSLLLLTTLSLSSPSPPPSSPPYHLSSPSLMPSPSSLPFPIPPLSSPPYLSHSPPLTFLPFPFLSSPLLSCLPSLPANSASPCSYPSPLLPSSCTGSLGSPGIINDRPFAILLPSFILSMDDSIIERSKLHVPLMCLDYILDILAWLFKQSGISRRL